MMNIWADIYIFTNKSGVQHLMKPFYWTVLYGNTHYHYNNCADGSHKKHNKSTICSGSLHYTCYLSCIRAWWWTDSFQDTRPKPKIEYISGFDWCFTLLSSTTDMVVVRMQQGGTYLELWWWVFNFTPRPLYSQGSSTQYPLNGWLNVPQCQSGHFGD
jgi:hypothetical protein